VNTVLFGSACVIGTMVFGFAVALLLNQRLRGNVLFSIAVLLPWAVPALAASAIWKWLFDSRYGFVNWALVNLGFDSFQDYAWFAGRFSAYVAIFITVVWQSFPIVAVLVVFSTIWDFKIFDQIYVMAAGVPDRSADTAAVAAYREGFALSHYGLGSAVAVVLFLILLILSILYVRLIGKEGEL
jgi:N,N'-diacetylchitobiose transport system permease protein